MKRFNLRLATSLMALITLLIVVSCKRHETTMVCSLRTHDSIATLEIPLSISLLDVERDSAIVIKISEKTALLLKDDLIESYTFIPLETTPESLVGNIEKMEFDGSLCVVFDELNNSI